MKNAGLYLPALKQGVVVFDGGLGTQIQARDLTADDYGGGALEGAVEGGESHVTTVTPQQHPKLSSTTGR